MLIFQCYRPQDRCLHEYDIQGRHSDGSKGATMVLGRPGLGHENGQGVLVLLELIPDFSLPNFFFLGQAIPFFLSLSCF